MPSIISPWTSANDFERSIPFAAAAAQVVERVIEKLDTAGRPFEALFEIEIRAEYVPARKLRIVDLEDDPRIHDPAVFLAKRFGDGDAVLFPARVVFVFVPIGELRRRDRRHEGFDVRNAGERLFEIVDVAFERLLSATGDGAGANPFDRGCWRRRANTYAMIRRQAIGIGTKLGNHSFRATGITAYLKNGGTLEKAAVMANHASTRTTQLYDRRRDEVASMRSNV
jgi:hypothetical protein